MPKQPYPRVYISLIVLDELISNRPHLGRIETASPVYDYHLELNNNVPFAYKITYRRTAMGYCIERLDYDK